jgi:hypothetical protein
MQILFSSRIENDEVIHEHEELVDYHKQRNDILSIDISPEGPNWKNYLAVRMIE